MELLILAAAQSHVLQVLFDVVKAQWKKVRNE
jgi:hypothetical protein